MFFWKNDWACCTITNRRISWIITQSIQQLLVEKTSFLTCFDKDLAQSYPLKVALLTRSKHEVGRGSETDWRNGGKFYLPIAQHSSGRQSSGDWHGLGNFQYCGETIILMKRRKKSKLMKFSEAISERLKERSIEKIVWERNFLYSRTHRKYRNDKNLNGKRSERHFRWKNLN